MDKVLGELHTLFLIGSQALLTYGICSLFFSKWIEGTKTLLDQVDSTRPVQRRRRPAKRHEGKSS